MNRLEKYIFSAVAFVCIASTGVAATYLTFQYKGMIGVVSMPEVAPGQYAELNRRK